MNPNQERAGLITFTPDGSQLVITTGDGPSTDVWDLRAIRGQLAAMGLDWDLPAYPAAADGVSPPGEVHVERGRAFGPLTAGYPASIGLNSLVLSLNAFNGEAHYQRGRAYAMEGEYAKAIADYTMALTLLPPQDPRRPEILFRRSNNYYHVGDKARGLADLRQLVSMELGHFSGLHADLAWRLNEIAWQLVMSPEKERNPALALPLAQRALTLATPELGTYRTTLGVVYYRLGQYHQAAEVLERSLRESTPDETAGVDLFFLALSHARLGHAAKGLEHYQQAVACVNEHRSQVPFDQQAQLDACWAEARALLGADRGS